MSQPDPYELIEHLHDALSDYLDAIDIGTLRFHYLDGDTFGQLRRLDQLHDKLERARRWRGAAEDWMQAGDEPEIREPAVNPAHTPGDYARLSDARFQALGTLRTAAKVMQDIVHSTTSAAELDKLIGEAIRILHETTKR